MSEPTAPAVGRCKFALFIGYEPDKDPDAPQHPPEDTVLDDDDIDALDEEFVQCERKLRLGLGFHSLQGLYEEFSLALQVARAVQEKYPVWWHIADLELFQIIATDNDNITLQ